MSDDDLGISFGEVTYREPRRARRPDRDRARVCIAVEVPRSSDLPIFLDLKPADAIERHALRDTSVELGGILLGRECLDEETGAPFVWITEALEAKHYENTQASFTYTHDSWAEINRERDEKHPDLDIIGWYHTHPDFGIFLSGHDLFIHHHFFAQPLNVAYVVDPIRQTRGFFQWHEDQMSPLGGFTLTAERGERLALARFVNELEHIPNVDSGGGGGGISPRLESELIAMLNRPHTTVVAQGPGSVAQTGAVFALLGMLIGVLGVVAVMWLNTLARTLQDQAEALKAVERVVAGGKEDVAYARLQAKQQALEALLGNLRVGANAETFTEAYEKVARERDEARKALAAVETDKIALNEKTSKLLAGSRSFEERLAAADQKAATARREAADSKKAYEADVRELNAKVKAAEDLVEQTGSGALNRKYQMAWFAAAGGLGGCVLLALAVVWAFTRYDNAEPTGGPTHASPPHSIS